MYRSSHGSSEILASGFFQGVGAGSRSSSNPSTSGFATVCPGVNVLDALISISSTNPNTGIPGHTVITAFISATANVASTTLSSGWNAAYDCSVAAST